MENATSSRFGRFSARRRSPFDWCTLREVHDPPRSRSAPPHPRVSTPAPPAETKDDWRLGAGAGNREPPPSRPSRRGAAGRSCQVGASSAPGHGNYLPPCIPGGPRGGGGGAGEAVGSLKEMRTTAEHESHMPVMEVAQQVNHLH
ncbi:uncharacterized protein LOC135115866 isoform X2 [Scylla paramamosain]